MLVLIQALTILTIWLAHAQAVAVSFANSTLAPRDAPLWEIKDALGTYYYDLTGRDICGVNGCQQPGWSKSSGMDTAITKCGQLPMNDPKLNTNRIVALDWSAIMTDRRAFCGKEVEVYRADGTKFEFSEGPLVLWEACERCMCEKAIDFSALAHAELMNGRGGACSPTNPHGLRVVVTNNQIWEPDLGQLGAGVASTWSPTKKIAPIPLHVTNPSPVYPCRTPGNTCAFVRPDTGGMPDPNLRGPCVTYPEAIESTINWPLALPVQAKIGEWPAQVPAPPAVGGLPSSTSSGSAASQTLGPPAAPQVANSQPPPAGPLGKCVGQSTHSCVGKTPAVCDALGNWVQIASACPGSCVMQANNAPGCV